jgi:hypothetical protein
LFTITTNEELFYFASQHLKIDMNIDIVTRIKNHLRQLPPHVARRETATLLRDAVTEIENLTRDKQRLDWLADKENKIGNIQLPTVCVEANINDMRLAIDAAMALHNAELTGSSLKAKK